eukprot:TRINITY_DN16848_c1_g1_i1.p1 TRINITY_DN16848_c1_g1~~TRINITY_DN16848_c1_g1_i1.p1  ORF type:complete len:155 (-),score=29.23 TRINITY_DN16848_c1_g1_i1:355-780(-)
MTLMSRLLHSRRLQPTIVTWNAAVASCGKGRQLDMLLYLVGEMRQSSARGAGPRPDTITYNAAVSACETPDGRWWELALALLGEMAAQRLRLNPIVCSATLGAISCAGLPAAKGGLPLAPGLADTAGLGGYAALVVDRLFL